MDFETAPVSVPDCPEDVLEVFSVSELDERFEFVTWCNNQCNCTKQG
jgi:hypothetical protein